MEIITKAVKRNQRLNYILTSKDGRNEEYMRYDKIFPFLQESFSMAKIGKGAGHINDIQTTIRLSFDCDKVIMYF